MKVIHLGTVQSVVVYSDVHLREPADATTALFVQTLKAINNIDVVILLGDIFDFIYAGHSFYWKRWAEVWNTLQHLKNKGTKLCFLEGNHDFGFEHFPIAELNSLFDVLGDCELNIAHPILGPVTFMHSDHLVCPWHYPWFRRVVKSAPFQYLSSLVPAHITYALFESVATVSRSRDYKRPLDLAYVLQKLAPTLAKHHTVIGHLHSHINTTCYSNRLLCGPSWMTAPSHLTIHKSGTVERDFFGKQVPKVL